MIVFRDVASVCIIIPYRPEEHITSSISRGWGYLAFSALIENRETKEKFGHLLFYLVDNFGCSLLPDLVAQ